VDAELDRLRVGAAHASELGLEVHAGHGLTFNTVKAIAVIPEVIELNIGHFLIGEGIFVGLDRAIGQIRAMMADARGPVIADPSAQNISGVA
jgi:pyridoxine 5-phosphate synthase